MTTGTTVARSQEAQSYLDRVGAALADLPEEERADLLDELGTHVDEIAAEGTSSLEARLGSPEDYAAELRASAGLPPARTRGRTVVDVLGRVHQLRGRPNVAAVERFLVSLRPVWWVARAWIAVAMLTWFSQPHWLRSLAVVPDVGSAAASILVLVAAVVVSVQLGRRGRLRSAQGRWLVAAVNVAALLALWPVLLTVNEAVMYGTQTYYYGDPQPRVVKEPPAEGVYSAGQQVWNIYAYDPAGRMLHDVRLYDQDGKPLSLGLAYDKTKQQTVDAAGQRVDNAFPYRYVDPTTGEVTNPEAAPLYAAPPLLGVPAASAAPTAPSAPPAATPAPSPTHGKQ